MVKNLNHSRKDALGTRREDVTKNTLDRQVAKSAKRESFGSLLRKITKNEFLK